MKKTTFVIFLILLFVTSALSAQLWEQNDAMFNTSGVPSLPFSQPRFADLDGDGDQDMILGNINTAPVYIENVGTPSSPSFTQGYNIFEIVQALDAEMGVCADLDNDEDLDLITGGYTGLNYYENTGSITNPDFAEVPGFFTGLDVGLNPIPDLADIDDDGDLDMVVGLSEDGLVKLYTNTGSAQLAEFTENSTMVLDDVGLYAYPNFSDLDDDDDQDILVGRDGHGFRYYQNNGTPQNGIWEVNNNTFSGLGSETYWNSPGLTDINGDGTNDLIFGTAAGPLLYYENNGTPSLPSWQENVTLFGGIIDVGGASNPFFYDFDADGDMDMISGSNLGAIKYYENTGTVSAPAWTEDSNYFASIDHSIYSAITLGDVDADGLPDAIVGDLSGNLFFHHNTGTGYIYDSEMLSLIDLGGWSAPRLIDFDEDNDLDIVTGNEAGNLHYFENQGTPATPDWVELAGYFANIDVGSNCVPTIGDINLDNSLNVITGDLWGEVQCFANFLGFWSEFNTPVAGLSGGQNTTPALADLDDDGDLDLTLGNYDGTFNYYENLQIDVNSDPYQIPFTPIFMFNYPNPFNPSTTIYFLASGLSSQEEVELGIYNVKGQKVKSYIINCHPEFIEGSVYDSEAPRPSTELRMKQAGSAQHSVTWNGTDQYNQPVSSGIYFYKLAVGKQVKTRKMIFLK